MANFGIHGAAGRMGKLLADYLVNSGDHRLAALYDRGEIGFYPNALVTNDLDKFLAECEIVVDFSAPSGTETLLEKVMQIGKKLPLVIGTTGLNAHQQNLLKLAAEKTPVLYATNMSLGIALLNKLVYDAAKALKDFDIEIVEMHHKHKKDAPSGTALTLAKSAAMARDLELDKARVSGRDGIIGERSKDEIGVLSLRGGDIVGDHAVGFYGEGEYIKLQHTATSRATFATGAIKAGGWLLNQQNGLYSIQDYFRI
ncbi:MAG: 4-hydroxy-tetrahydrodipicolinate reductase [Helicobacteraceae bacterium]|jgi:4-hydroxy-tetrahydrodipicolinate reductase|nr:4-hydroxy-tetrahydrodipicolinate reductase [Helicobacteraceae bacterium]